MNKKNCLIVGGSLSSKTIGGSEFRLLVLTKILSKFYDVTILIPNAVDLEEISSVYGIALDGKISVVPTAPQGKIELFLARIINYRRLFCIRKYARLCDVCISCENMIDFGKPGIHFIYMANFDHDFRNWIITGKKRTQNMYQRFVRKAKDRVKCLFFFKPRYSSEIILSPQETVIANSHWIANAISNYYCTEPPRVIYPPVLCEIPAVDWASREDAVLVLGRVDEEKKLENIIAIMDEIRKTKKIELHIAGNLRDTPYVKSFLKSCASRPWIVLHGLVYGMEKVKLLQRFKFALHARDDEEFGISVGEYVKAGMIPVVPNRGGAAEIVGISGLKYADLSQAIEIMLSLLNDEMLCRQYLVELEKRRLFLDTSDFTEQVSNLLIKRGVLPVTRKDLMGAS